MIKRLLLVSALVLALVAHSAGQPAVGADGTDVLTKLRIEVTTSSNWASIELRDLDVRTRHTTSTHGVQKLWVRESGWTVVASDSVRPATVVIDLVAELAHGSDDPLVSFAQGRAGASQLSVLITTGAQPVPVARLGLDATSGDTTAQQGIDRASLLSQQLRLPEVDPRNLSLAFYYPWFGAGAVDDRHVNPDKPGSWYDTTNPSHVRGMVDQADSAGLDGFLVSWDGAKDGAAVDLLTNEIASHPGMVVAPLLELGAMRSRTLLGDRFDAGKAVRAVNDFVARTPEGSLLRVGARPVVVVFGMWDLTAAEWAVLRKALTPQNPFLVGDRLHHDLPLEGHYLYDPNPLSIAELERAYDSALDQTHLTPLVDPTRQPILWAATASPGFDNRWTRLLLNRRYTPRDGGARYAATWRVAVGSRPEWVFVTSWNEWLEQTHISPGRSTGSTALEQTAGWTARFVSSAG